MIMFIHTVQSNLESMWPVCALLEENRAAGGNSQREITNSKKERPHNSTVHFL